MALGVALACFVGFGPAIVLGRPVVALARKALATGLVLAIVAACTNSAEAGRRRSNRYDVGEQRDIQAARNAFHEQARGTLQLVVSIGHQRVTLYSMPELRFQYDESIARADRLSQLIDSVRPKK